MLVESYSAYFVWLYLDVFEIEVLRALPST